MPQLDCTCDGRYIRCFLPLLTANISAGYYDGVIFHRCIDTRNLVTSLIVI